MHERNNLLLSINGGSSSIKYALYTQSDLRLYARGKIDRIGMDGMYAKTYTAETETEEHITLTPTDDPLTVLTSLIAKATKIEQIVAVGHRIVHGGTLFSEPTIISKEVIDALHTLTSLAPRHIPVQLSILQGLMNVYVSVPHIACFDTAFYRDLPRLAHIIPLPRKFESQGIRRYGFHGLSYEYIMGYLRDSLSVAVEQKRIIIAHLGSGCSVTAIRDGIPIDTSMGFSPTSGVSMGTRSGDLDPGIFEYMTSTLNISPHDFNHIVNYESGSLGISETTADMEVLIRESETDPRAHEAVSFFAYSVQKMIGALAVALGGIDILVFTGGIGEQSSIMRRLIVERLALLGISLNVITNTAQKTCISDSTSRVILYVIPTDEEYMIAKHVHGFL
jgi:acetate kinase